jgi:glycosyltransferase involved in cell wall biosynthesis
MIPLSVVIITHNEEKNLPRCIHSVTEIADEIIVVDDFSTDRTEKICHDYGVRYIHHAFEGHIEQKNFALTQSSYPYILSVDADEEVSETLREEIVKVKQNWHADGYRFNRLNIYCGKPIRHGGWYPDRKLRLFDKRKAKWGGINPHDRILMNKRTKIKMIRGSLFHYSYLSTEEHMKKVISYTDIFSRTVVKQQGKAGYFRLLVHPLWKFFRNYFLRLGFLDGATGLTISAIQSYETFLKYSKIIALRKNGKARDNNRILTKESTLVHAGNN